MPTDTHATAPAGFALSSVEAQRALIALILNHPYSGETVLDKCDERRVTKEFFTVPAYGEIFGLIRELNESTGYRANIDLQMLRIEVAKRACLPAVGGNEVLDSLEDMDVNPASDDLLITTICDVHTAMRIHESATRAMRECRTKSNNIPAVLDRYQADALAISDLAGAGEAVPIGDLQGDVENHIRLLQSGVLTGISTGLQQLDEILSGFQRKDMIIVAARPSVGKTALALSIGMDMALPKQGNSEDGYVLFFSLEMGKEQLATRAYSARSQTNPRRMAGGLFDQSKFAKASRDLKAAKLLIYDKSGLTGSQIGAVARREHKRRKLKAIIVDYLQLVEHADPANTPREQQVSANSRYLKALAKDLDVPVIVLCQLNRDSAKEQRQPRLSDLRESGAIEQDADVALLLSRVGGDGLDKTDLLLVDVAKHRNGPTGQVYLHFNGGTNHFRPATEEERAACKA